MKSDIDSIYRLVKRTCKKPSNEYGYDAWSGHIKIVYEYALRLADQLHADQELVAIAALLHDFASVSNKKWYEDHHIHGAMLAREILSERNYPEDRIKHIEECILTHRGSKSLKRETLEAEILASADAMAHFDNIPSLLFLAYSVKKMSVNEGKKFVFGKLTRSYAKMMPAAREMVRDKYDYVEKMLCG